MEPPADWLVALNARLDRIESNQEKILQVLKKSVPKSDISDDESDDDDGEDLMLIPAKTDLRRILIDTLFESRERVQKNPDNFDAADELARIYESFESMEEKTKIDVPVWNLDALKEKKTANSFVAALSALRGVVDIKTDEQLKSASVFDNFIETSGHVNDQLETMKGVLDGVLKGKTDGLNMITEALPQSKPFIDAFLPLFGGLGLVSKSETDPPTELQKNIGNYMSNVSNIVKSMPTGNLNSFQIYPMAFELIKYQSYSVKQLIESQEFFDKLKEVAVKYQAMGQEDLIEMERIPELPKFNYERDGLLFDTCCSLKEEMTGFAFVAMLRGYVLLLQVASGKKYDWLVDATPENIKKRVSDYLYRN